MWESVGRPANHDRARDALLLIATPLIDSLRYTPRWPSASLGIPDAWLNHQL